ncbi:MAG: DNA polymerase Y family protein [Myxococcota bacterium]|nr:DNA polymerase Y family protein [Myxococcota bacterium]
MACVHFASFALQCMARQEQDWARRPLVVLTELRPQAAVKGCNALARSAGIRVGQSFATALSLQPELRAICYDAARIDAQREELMVLLRTLSPNIERVDDVLGDLAMASGRGVVESLAFFLDSSGLDGLYGGTQQWLAALARALSPRWQVSIVLAFRRFASYAIAATHRGLKLLSHPEQERHLLSQVPLDGLALAPELSEALHRLGLRRLGEFMALPELALLERFGPRAAALHRWAYADERLPLQPRQEQLPILLSHDFEPPVFDTPPLLFAARPMLETLFAQLLMREEQLNVLHLELELERASLALGHAERPSTWCASLRPAAANTELAQWLDLLRLKFDTLSLDAGVQCMRFSAEGLRLKASSGELFADSNDGVVSQQGVASTRARLGSRMSRARHALARIRAELGDRCVQRAYLLAAHLPEAQVRWLPFEELREPRPSKPIEPSMVRRIFAKAVPLVGGRHGHDVAHCVRATASLGGELVRYIGPYEVSGGWWQGELRRAYYYVQLTSGAILWLYFDEKRKRCCLQGMVE